MNKEIIIYILVICILVLGAWYIFGRLMENVEQISESILIDEPKERIPGEYESKGRDEFCIKNPKKCKG